MSYSVLLIAEMKDTVCMYVHDTCKQESVKAVHKCSIGETPLL